MASFHDLGQLFGCEGFLPEVKNLFLGYFVIGRQQSLETICLQLRSMSLQVCCDLVWYKDITGWS
jgi:hypothetical protein